MDHGKPIWACLLLDEAPVTALRLLSSSSALFLLAALTQACVVTSTDTQDPLPSEDPNANKLPKAPAPTIAQPSQNNNNANTPPPATKDADYLEVVYLFMRGHDNSSWMCTGTLVAKDKVVTAAHCLDPKEFATYEIIAPNAPGSPRIGAKAPTMFGGDYNDVAQPDIGFLTLNEPVVLPEYAVLTDVVARVEGGEKLTATAVIRTEQVALSPFRVSSKMPLSSSVELGYDNGFATPMFSKGGDSGAGLFLVENGKTTHKLIGVARQPDPDRQIDHFTRVGASFKQWYETKNPAPPGGGDGGNGGTK
jgi:hypothetical protein